jgi:NADP-dependent 3-hydroxy acid dehydrogenase YdfG
MPAGTKLAVVAGSRGDVGSATAARFREAGWRVVGLARAASDAPVGVGVDLSNRAAVEEAAARIAAAGDELRCVVLCAGAYHGVDSVGADSRTFRDNVGVADAVLAAFTPHLLERAGARVITVGSIDAVYPNPSSLAYSSAKAAVHSLVALYRKKHKASSLRFDLVAAGAINGRMRAGKAEDKAALLQPDDIARLCVALADFGSHVAFEDIVMIPKTFAYTKT